MTDIAPISAQDLVPSDLRSAWETHRMVPLWESPTAHKLDVAREQPHAWPWSVTQPILQRTAEIQSPKAVERRVLSLVSPFSKHPEDEFTCGTVCATLQTLLPGERARPHRHSMNALRFVMEGMGAATIVDGKDCPMEPGDLVLTPGWCWHEHYHAGAGPTIWMDVLDVYLHLFLGTDDFQPGPVRDQIPQYDDVAFSTANILPGVDGHHRNYSPVFRYPRAEAWRALQNAPVGADGGKKVRYVNPVDGGSVMSTLDCYLMAPLTGAATRPYQSTANTVCCVVGGSGHSVIGGKRIDWKAHDIFTVPQNLWASHYTDDPDTSIFMVTDREVYRKLGLLQEHYQD